ncbi:DUF4136 domain-containing protein [Pedobacter changchengzhani]|uniref:DUF4136 domain-containing protein n=1 Tax=Pedobacter changchengzhani TaxID=2529274 RepID=A0A4R5MMB4_9SPHI|nr:DUF4136 domain-containing protein [Pedobacter changchengzhani]TDG36808.1 DUF4136 domain-containing protein [Pedobacter changchengzhani]
MKTANKLIMLITVVMVFSGCSSLRTASDFDSKTNFSNFKTYDFYEKGMARLKLNDLDKRRMVNAIETEMAAKGFSKSSKPDLLVNLVVVGREVNEIYNNAAMWGWRYPFWGGNMATVNQFTEGTIIIDFLDPMQKKLIWHGLGQGFNLDNFNKREERMQKGVNEILAQYPPKQ